MHNLEPRTSHLALSGCHESSMCEVLGAKFRCTTSNLAPRTSHLALSGCHESSMCEVLGAKFRCTTSNLAPRTSHFRAVMRVLCARFSVRSVDAQPRT